MLYRALLATMALGVLIASPMPVNFAAAQSVSDSTSSGPNSSNPTLQRSLKGAEEMREFTFYCVSESYLNLNDEVVIEEIKGCDANGFVETQQDDDRTTLERLNTLRQEADQTL